MEERSTSAAKTRKKKKNNEVEGRAAGESWEMGTDACPRRASCHSQKCRAGEAATQNIAVGKIKGSSLMRVLLYRRADLFKAGDMSPNLHEELRARVGHKY